MKKLGLLILFSLIITSVILIYKSNKIVNKKVEKSFKIDTLSNNSLVINKEYYVLKVDDKIVEFTDKKALLKSIVKNKSIISKFKLNVFLRSKNNDRDFILDFISTLNQANITNYEIFSSLKSDEVATKASEHKIIKPSDIDSIKIEIKDSNLEISVHKNHLISNNEIEIENLIKTNLQHIRKSQIYIIGKPETSYQKAKPIFDLLKKYDLYNFKIITK